MLEKIAEKILAKKIQILSGGIRGVGAFFSLFLQVCLIYMFGAEEYGKYVVYITLISFLSVAARGGGETILIKKIATNLNREKVENVFASSLFSAILNSLVVSLLFLFVAYFWEMHRSSSSYVEFYLVFFGVLNLVGMAFINAKLRAENKFLFADTCEILLKNVFFLLVCSVAYCFEVLEGGVILSYAVSGFIFMAIYLAVFDRGVLKKIKNVGYHFSVTGGGEHWKFSAINYLSFIFFQLDTLLLSHFISAVDLGAYNMACNFVRLVIFFPMIVASQMQPKFASEWKLNKYKDIRNGFDSALSLGVGSALISVLLLLVFGKQLLQHVNADFGVAANSLYILCFAHFFNAVLIISSSFLVVVGEHRYVLLSQCCGGGVVLIGYFILMPIYKMEGAAFSVFIGVFFSVVILLKKIYGGFLK